jgi:flagellar basal-body rod protein FlgB
MKLFDLTNIPMLNRAMDAYALRHKAIASNLANITTVGYRAKKVTFEDELAAADQGVTAGVVTTNPRHIGTAAAASAGADAKVVEARTANPSSDEPLASGVNDVDLDSEMGELAKNQIRYKFSSRLMAETFKSLQKSIRGTL